MLPEQAHIAWKRLQADLELADSLGAKSLPVENLRKRMRELETGLPLQATFLSEEPLGGGHKQDVVKPGANGSKTAAATGTEGEVVKSPLDGAPAPPQTDVPGQRVDLPIAGSTAAAAEGQLAGGFQAPTTGTEGEGKKKRTRKSKTEATDTRFK